MRKLILVSLFCLVYNILHSQKQYNYLFYVDNTVRTGALLFNEKTNTAEYIDKMENLKSTKAEGKPVFTVSVDGFNDFVYYKKNVNELNYTYELLKIPYFINDSTININWELHSDQKEIQGLNCKKATTLFRGRKWIVWYCPDIPVVYGPWKFYGLPGLIVEATEDSNRFAFVLTEILEKPTTVLPNLNLSKHKQIDLKTFDEIFHDAMNLKDLKNSRGYVIEGESFKRQGIELIYEWEEQKK